MLRIGINGFGRIGRALTRMNLKYQHYDLVAINDIDPDINNLAYLLKYDTTYGKLDYAKVEVGENSLIINEKITKVFSNKSILSIPWYDMGIDVVIDASGVFENVLDSNILIGNGVKKVIITHSPKKILISHILKVLMKKIITQLCIILLAQVFVMPMQ